MLKVKNLNKYFNRKSDNEIHVINNTSFCIPNNGLVAILGTSGSGKTTLLNSLCGIDKVDSGEITIDDKVIVKYKGGMMDDIRSKYFGYVFQNYNLIGDITVFENVAFSLKMIGIKDKEEIRRRTIRALEIVKMDKYKNRYAKNLSGGQQQRVSIARAIVKDPKFILADEPTGNLDRKNTIITMSMLKEISKSRLVIMVTHERELANAYADRIMEIKDGVLISDSQNINTGEFVFNDENLIHLGDLEKDVIHHQDNVEITRYTSNGELGDIKIDFVVSNNQIFIKSSSNNYQIRIVDDNSLVKFTDSKLEKETLPLINEEDVQIEKIDHTKIKGKYTPNIGKIFLESFAKIIKMKFIKRMVLLLFLVASLLLTCSIGLYRGATFVNEKEFMNANRDIITVTMNQADKEDAYQLFTDLRNREEVYGTNFNESSVMITQEVYNYTTYNMSTTIENIIVQDINEFSNIDKKLLDKLDDHSLLIDQKLVDYIIRVYNQYYQTEKTLLNQTFTINGEDYKVVGITNYDNYSFYGNSLVSTKCNYFSTYTDTEAARQFGIDNTLVNGEIKVNEKLNHLYKINDKINFLGNSLTIVGYYLSDNTDFVINEKTLEKIAFDTKWAQNNRTFNIFSNNYKETIEEYQKNVNISLMSPYATSREISQNTKVIMSSVVLVIAIISFVAPLLMLYFLMRSSTISKSKEIGIYRALGLRNSSIITMNFVEVFTMALLYAIPGYIISLIFMNSIKLNVQVLFRVDAVTVIASFISILVLVTVVGLLPVLRLVKNTPQKIMTKYDI